MLSRWKIKLKKWKIKFIMSSGVNLDYSVELWDGVSIRVKEKDGTTWTLALSVMKDNCLCYKTEMIRFVVIDWFLHYHKS